MPPSLVDLHPQLAKLEQQLAKIRQEARILIERSAEGSLVTRPGPGEWSILECLAHLNVTGEAYLEAFDRAIEQGKVAGRYGPGPYHIGLFGRWFLSYLEPPIGLKINAPKRLAPPLELHPASVTAGFFTLQDALLHRLRQANGLELNRLTVPSPASTLVRFNLYEALVLVLAHERRHLWQAERVRERLALKEQATAGP